MAIRIPPFEYPKVRNQFGHAPDFADTKHPEQVQSISMSIFKYHIWAYVCVASDPNYSKTSWFNLIEQTLELSCIPPVARHTVLIFSFHTHTSYFLFSTLLFLILRTQVSTRTFKTNSKASKHTHGAWPVELKNMERQDRDKYVLPNL